MPNDPRYPEQWYLRKVQADLAWPKTTGRPGAVLAIVDTGIDLTHIEFAGRILPGRNTRDGTSNVQDQHGRGTLLAGIAVATGDNSVGIAGLDWQVGILPVKVTDANASNTYQSVADGIRYAVDRGARVILTGVTTQGSLTIKTAVDYALSRGCLIVAPAGDEGMQNIWYPAKFPGVLSVGSTDENDRWGGWDGIPRSNFGVDIDIVAPGMRILTTALRTRPGGWDTRYWELSGYRLFSGTIMAAAIVAGCASLVAAVNPYWTGQQIYDRLRSTVDPISSVDAVNFPNAGIVNVNKALGGVVTPPPPVPAVPTAPSNVQGSVQSTSINYRVSWEDNSNNELRFEIRWRRAGTGFWEYRTYSANIESAFITLSGYGDYEIEVRSGNEVGDSTWVSKRVTV